MVRTMLRVLSAGVLAARDGLRIATLAICAILAAAGPSPGGNGPGRAPGIHKPVAAADTAEVARLEYAPRVVPRLDPRRPYVDRDVCPFECCQYGRWRAQSRLRVWRRENDTSRVAFTLAPGDSFEAIGGNVHVTRPGIVRMTRPTRIGEDFPFVTALGESLFVLAYLGEDTWHVWRRGKIYNIEKMWGPEAGARTHCVVLREAEQHWWVRIRDSHGRNGWLLMDEARVSGSDACE